MCEEDVESFYFAVVFEPEVLQLTLELLLLDRFRPRDQRSGTAERSRTTLCGFSVGPMGCWIY